MIEYHRALQSRLVAQGNVGILVLNFKEHLSDSSSVRDAEVW
jgi:hypothetical protein